MPKPLRVAVVSQYQLTRLGLTELLGLDPERAVVVDTSSMDGHLSGEDVVVYDLTALLGSRADGEDDLRHLLAGGIPVLGLAPAGRPDLAEGAVAMGVADVVPVSVTAAELLRATERVAAGQVVDHEDRSREERDELRQATGLSEREVDILELIASGLSNKDIAARLYLSVNSIKTYIRTAYRKIGVTTRSEAVLWAIRHRLTRPWSAPDTDGPARRG